MALCVLAMVSEAVAFAYCYVSSLRIHRPPPGLAFWDCIEGVWFMENWNITDDRQSAHAVELTTCSWIVRSW